MRQLIRHFFLKIFVFLANRSALFYIGISILLHFIYLIVFKQFHNPNSSILYFIRGDAIGYVTLSENLHTTGVYIADNDATIRMPGMTFLYLPLRYFFSQHFTLYLFIILQTLLSSFSTYLVARIAENIFKSKKIFLIVFVVNLISTYVSNYNNFLLTESLAVSTLIISIYCFMKSFHENNGYFVFISGLFFTWTVFLRPFIIPILLCFVVYTIIYNKHKIRYSFLFILPFFICETLWVTRNYSYTGKVILFQTATPQTYDIKNEFLKSFGMNLMYDAEGAWFLTDKQIKRWETVRPNDNIFPEYIFTQNLSLDSLKYARYCLWQTENEHVCFRERLIYKHKANAIFSKFIDAHSFFTTQIYSRFVLLFRFLNQPIGAPLRSITYPFNVLVVFIDSLINYFVFISGFISLFYFASNFKKNFSIVVLICSIPAYILFLFPIYLQFIEAREITLAYPFLSILSVALFVDLFHKYTYRTLFFYVLCFSILAYFSCMRNISW